MTGLGQQKFLAAALLESGALSRLARVGALLPQCMSLALDILSRRDAKCYLLNGNYNQLYIRLSSWLPG